MNIVTLADIKRGGMAALDAALKNGPAHIMKRNRPAAVVLSEQAYAELLARAHGSTPARAAVELFLAPMPEGALDPKAVTRRLAASAAEWAER